MTTVSITCVEGRVNLGAETSTLMTSKLKAKEIPTCFIKLVDEL